MEKVGGDCWLILAKEEEVCLMHRGVSRVNGANLNLEICAPKPNTEN